MQLLDHPFIKIGMLFVNFSVLSCIHIGQIYDQHWRISPLDPFTDFHQFYLSQWVLLNQFYASMPMASTAYSPDLCEIVLDAEMPKFRKTRFFGIFKEGIRKRKDIDVTVFIDVIDSDHPFFASYLDTTGITGVRTWFPKAEFKWFLDKHCTIF
jgi:hypothetical protein